MLAALVQVSSILLFLHYIITTFLAWRKLRHFPGPRLASFSRLWLFTAAISGKAYLIRMALRRKYGGSGSSALSSGLGGDRKTLIRIGPDMLITDDPAIFKHINGAHTGYARGDWYAVMGLDPYQDTMIASTNTKFHDDVKARAAAGITGREVPAMEDDIDGVVRDLIQLIEGKYVYRGSPTAHEDGGVGNRLKPMDWAMVAQFFTLDALAKVAYGREFGHLKTDSDVFGYIKTVKDMALYIAICSDVPWLGKVFLNRAALWFFGPKATDTKGAGAVMG